MPTVQIRFRPRVVAAPPGRPQRPGAATPFLRQVWPTVMSVDLSPAMLARSSAPSRVLADAAALPIASASIAAAVLADAPLFVAELTRVLRPGGIIVWSNALGDAAPHYVPPEVLLRALAGHSPEREWTAVTSVAGWGAGPYYCAAPAGAPLIFTLTSAGRLRISAMTADRKTSAAVAKEVGGMSIGVDVSGEDQCGRCSREPSRSSADWISPSIMRESRRVRHARIASWPIDSA